MEYLDGKKKETEKWPCGFDSVPIMEPIEPVYKTPGEKERQSEEQKE